MCIFQQTHTSFIFTLVLNTHQDKKVFFSSFVGSKVCVFFELESSVQNSNIKMGLSNQLYLN